MADLHIKGRVPTSLGHLVEQWHRRSIMKDNRLLNGRPIFDLSKVDRALTNLHTRDADRSGHL